MKRNEFIKTTGLGIGGFILGVGLNLGMIFNELKKPTGKDIILELSEDGGKSYDVIGMCTSLSLTWSMDIRDIT